MKKLLVICCAIGLCIGVGTAHADSWTINTSSYNVLAYVNSPTGSPTTTYINSWGFYNPTINGVVQPTTINQYFTGGADNNVLDVGDTFDEFGMLVQVQADSAGIFYYTGPNGTPLQAYAYLAFEGLAGEITSINYGGDGPTTRTNWQTNILNDDFTLAFDPGAGSVKLYFDTDFNPANGVIGTNGLTGQSAASNAAATWTLLSGLGTSPIPLINRQEGQFGVVLGFTDVADGVWSFSPSGTKFEDFLAAGNAITMSSFNLGATLQDINYVNGVPADGTGNLLLHVVNDGDFGIQAAAVPEPSTMILLGVGVLGLAGLGRKKLL